MELTFSDFFKGIGTASNKFTCADLANLTNPHNYTVTISSSFCKGGAAPYSWLMKEIFTTVTLSSGFKGGEVTPLFYIGAALGNAIGMMFRSKYVDLFAATGFVGKLVYKEFIFQLSSVELPTHLLHARLWESSYSEEIIQL